MDTNRFKKKDEDKQKWVDWLTDTAPSLDVQEQLRKAGKGSRGAGRYVPRVYDLPKSGHTADSAATPTTNKQKAKKSKDTADDGAISINISFPEIHAPNLGKLKQTTIRWIALGRKHGIRLWQRAKPYVMSKQFAVWAGAFVVIILIWGLLAFNKQHLDKKKTTEAAKTPAATSTTPKISGTGGKTPPPYTPVVPATKPELVTPDGTHSRYDPEKRNYSFYDTLSGNKTFVVSQQQLPTSSAAAQAAAAAAKNLKTTKQLKSGWGTVYLVQNTKYKSEIMVFNVREMLVFIQASFTVDDETWTDYINALQ